MSACQDCGEKAASPDILCTSCRRIHNAVLSECSNRVMCAGCRDLGPERSVWAIATQSAIDVGWQTADGALQCPVCLGHVVRCVWCRVLGPAPTPAPQGWEHSKLCGKSVWLCPECAA